MLQLMRKNQDKGPTISIIERLVAPPPPASLRTAETRLRELRNEHGAENEKLNQAYQAEWKAGLEQSSAQTMAQRKKTDDLAAKVKAASAAVTDERRAFEPKFLNAVSLPVAAAVDAIAADLERIDLLANRLHLLHVEAGHAGLQSPFERARELVDAIRYLRLAIGPRSS